MEKKYSSVIDMIKDTTEDREFAKSLEKTIASKQISKMLFFLRCKAGLNQEELAKKMKCSQGKVSKIEHAEDGDFTIKDIVNYCEAVNMNLEIGFSDPNITMVDQVKYRYFELKDLLYKMLDIAKGDTKMEEGVSRFLNEVFVKVTFGIFECMSLAIPKKAEMQKGLHVSKPVIATEMSSLREKRKKKPFAYRA